MTVQTAEMEYYIDAGGNYMGGFDAGNPSIDAAWTKISAPPPLHASQTTTDNGATWSAYP